MCFKIVYVIVCVLKTVLSCVTLSEPVTLLYRDGDILDFQFTHMARSKLTKSIEISGQICNSSEFVPLLVIDGLTDDRFWNIITLYEKIDMEQNICSYYTNFLETSSSQRHMQLFELVYDTDRSVSADTAPKIFHYKITLDWHRFCFDVNETTEVTSVTAPELDAEVIEKFENQYYHEIKFICTPENVNNPSTINFVSNLPVILANFASRVGYPRHIRMDLHEYDNNTYISCGNRPSVYEFQKPKWVSLKVHPDRDLAPNFPSFEKLHRYSEGETYELECTQRPTPYTIYYMRLNENNEILSAASSNEFAWNLAKKFKLTKKDHNSRLVCLKIECTFNRTTYHDECRRQELKVVKLVMKTEYIVDKGLETTVPTDKCQLPAYPPKGHYQVFNAPNAVPFQISDVWILDIKCHLGYGILNGENRLFCSSGVWSPSQKLPQCVPFCKLIPHPSVTYSCRSRDSGLLFTRRCEEYEPPGMLAIAECKKPDYISNDELPSMHCTTDGIWSNTPTCMPACGEVTPGGIELIRNGEYTKLGELPWHVGVYKKTTTPYEQICGGSIVRPNVVISAAHCFWDQKLPDDQKLRSAEDYAVAAGKLYRPWDDSVDNKYAQKADVISIDVPTRFHGQINNYMDDIAVLLLSKSFEYKPHIAPVCLNFDDNFDLIQISDGMIGKVPGWGVTSPGGDASPELKVVDLPIVPYHECYKKSPIGFRRYITSDKICAGYKNKATAVCTGDSGGGLVVAGDDHGVTRYYLRGVVSAAPDEVISCTANEITVFTHVIRHYEFVRTLLETGDDKLRGHENGTAALAMDGVALGNFKTTAGVQSLSPIFLSALLPCIIYYLFNCHYSC